MILHRYFLREVYGAFLAVTTILLLIFMSRHFVRYLAEAAAGNLPGDLVFKLLSVLTLSALELLLPFAFFFAVLFAFGRLYKDSEMTAAAACGYGLGAVLRGMLWPIALFSLLVAAVSFVIAPWAAELGHRLRDQAEAMADVTGIASGGFRAVSGDWVFYVEKLSDDRSQMENVFIQRTRDGLVDMFVAPTAEQYTDRDSGDRYLVLKKGHRYEAIEGTTAYRVSEYEQAAVRIERQEVSAGKRKRKALSTAQLIGSDDRGDIAELQWRISMPILATTLAVLGVLFSYTTPRQGRFAKLLGAILIYIAYSNLLGVAQTWVARGAVPPALGMWWVHALMFALTVVLVLRRYGWNWSVAVMSGRARKLVR